MVSERARRTIWLEGADFRAPKYLWECHMQARPRSRETGFQEQGILSSVLWNTQLQAVGTVTLRVSFCRKWEGAVKGRKGGGWPGLGKHLHHTCPHSPQRLDGEPVVTQLHPGPITVQDGHFSRPLGSTDLLRAPAHFPVPSTRVVLREVSLVWHLYGGRDFGPHSSHR